MSADLQAFMSEFADKFGRPIEERLVQMASSALVELGHMIFDLLEDKATALERQVADAGIRAVEAEADTEETAKYGSKGNNP